MKNKNITIWLVVIFLCGVFFSGLSYLAYKKIKPIVKKAFHKFEERRIANLAKAKSPLLIADFNNPEDLNKWSFNNTKAELSSEHAIKGKKSLKITFLPSNEASAAKIEKYFDYMLCADKLKYGKPHPQILQKIMRRFKLKPQETIYVGDMAIDAQAGRRAGIKTIIVATGSSARSQIKKEKPSRIIDRLKDIWLDRLID